MSSAGDMAERLAERYLQDAGLKRVARNFRCRMGEIDLIMQDGGYLVFVEVRLRKHQEFGGAAASIDRQKQQRIVKAAEHYLATLARTPPCRFDVVLLDALEDARIDWIRSAFDA
jgi:putative endonuclease